VLALEADDPRDVADEPRGVVAQDFGEASPG